MTCIGLVMVVVAAIAVAVAAQQRRRARAIRQVPTSTCAELRARVAADRARGGRLGFGERCEAVGTAQPTPGGPLAAPLTGTPCVWSRVLVKERYWHATHDENGDPVRQQQTRTVVDRRSDARFVLTDSTGAVLVDPAGIEPDGAQKVLDRFQPDSSGRPVPFLGVMSRADSDTIGYELAEWVLHPGVPVYVLGEAGDAGDGTPVIGQAAQGVSVLSTRSEAELTARARSRFRVAALGAAAAGTAGVGLIGYALTRQSVWHPTARSEVVYYLAAAAAGLLVWLLIVSLIAIGERPRRVVPAAAAFELREEPPAVVNFLANRMRVTPAAAVATLLDLAARKHLELYQPGNDPAGTLVRLGRVPPEQLSGYEQQVFNRVTRLIAGRGYARLADLDDHQTDGAFAWAKQLADTVAADAGRRRLVKNGRGAFMGVALVSVIAAACASCGLLSPVFDWIYLSGDSGGDSRRFNPREGFYPAVAVAVVVFIGVVYVMLLFGLRALPKWTDTAWGRQAAAYWLGIGNWLRGHDSFRTLPPAAVTTWGRYIAYGVALGAAPGAVSGIDLDVGANEMLWSDATGTRRPVRVTYRRPGAQSRWRLLAALCATLAIAAVGGGGAMLLHRYLPTPAWPTYLLAALAGLGLLWPLYRAVRAGVDLTAPARVRGQVLARTLANAPASKQDARFYLVIDDGAGDRLTAWLVGPALVDLGRVGDVVDITAERWSRWVTSHTDVPDRRWSPPFPAASRQ